MRNQIIIGEALRELRALPENAFDCCITSPPYYGLRDYGMEAQIGLEPSPEAFIERLADVFDEVRRCISDNGSLWVNIADSYAGSGKGAWSNTTGQKEVYVSKPGSPEARMSKTWPGIKPKDLIGIPWMLAFELRRRGWYLRQEIIWHKPNAMPESVTDRCVKSHESLFLLSKFPRYYFDHNAIQEPATSSPAGLAATFKRENSMRALAIPGQSMGTHRPDREKVHYNGAKRNKRDVWSINTEAAHGDHFAGYPEKLIMPCVLAGCPPDGIVFDPFMGTGTTAVAALHAGRAFLGIELNPNYSAIANRRTATILAAPTLFAP